MSADDHESYTPEKTEPIRLYIPPRLLLVPGAALVVGLTIGFVRGSRSASLRFLAENVHRPPTTVQGWYFYNKTKNYRVFLGGLKGGGKNAVGLGAAALGWVGIEEALKLAGAPWDEFSEVGAGLGTAAVFAAAYRLPWRTTRRVLPLGLMIGGLTKGLSWSKGRLHELRDSTQAQLADAEAAAVGSGSPLGSEEGVRDAVDGHVA